MILVVTSIAGAVVYPGTADAQRVQLDIELTTTETNAPARAAVEGEQPVILTFEYAGLGSGTHDLQIMEMDSVSDDVIREFTVEGDSGTRTFELSPAELSETKETGAEYRADIYVRWGDEDVSNTEGLMWQHTTVYTDGYAQLPDQVDAGEEITIEYYGWTSESQTYVRLMEDDPPHRSGGGNDETIRRESVSGPGYFEGTFTFTPSEFIEEGDEEGDGEIEVQARAADVSFYPDMVRNISVAEPEPEINAAITDVTPPSGEYAAGDDVRTQVEIENQGDQRHTFFVGYGVVDENGNIYDNDGTTGTQISLDPGERDTVTVSWTVEDDAPTGSYGIGTSVWAESNPSNLETRLDDDRVQNAFDIVDAPAQTDESQSANEDNAGAPETTDASDNNDNDAAGDDDPAGDPDQDLENPDQDEAEEDGPGLGPVPALTALLIVFLLARHRLR